MTFTGGILLDLLGGGRALLIVASITIFASLASNLSPGIRRAHGMPPAVREAVA